MKVRHMLTENITRLRRSMTYSSCWLPL